MFGGRGVHLVFHFKHDREVFCSISAISKHKVAFSTIAGIVVFTKESIGQHGS